MTMSLARQRPSGWWYPWIFVVGMMVVIAVNAVMITLALETFPGLDTEDAYRKGLKYNQTIAAAEAQDARGWQMAVAVAPHPGEQTSAAGGRQADVVATFTDRDGYPLSGLTVEAYLLRPTNSGHDASAALDEQVGGHYAAMVTLPLPGQWDVRVHARRGDETFQATRRIMMP
ncbi:FixH family protein [Defluviicoccus vanus]|uniref:FixH family protein n=1 Tax=Defluviicoccus vanus TaxID=111831 RepID=A0A7H1N4J1_9PROT|nr:FixH family protein [Defluviicoccus vanus]QNT70627.1 FixH family protein [Defluviicoccus vanus]